VASSGGKIQWTKYTQKVKLPKYQYQSTYIKWQTQDPEFKTNEYNLLLRTNEAVLQRMVYTQVAGSKAPSKRMCQAAASMLNRTVPKPWRPSHFVYWILRFFKFIIRSFDCASWQILIIKPTSEQDQDGTVVPSWSCSQATSKPVWHILLLCVQWKTPDDGKRNCPKHVEFHPKINMRN